MGQCGCGEINPIAVLKIGEYILVVDEYLGCDFCNNPIGLSLHIYSKKQFKEEWGADKCEELKPIDFRPDKYGCNSKHFNFIGEEELKKAAKTLEDDKEHVDNISEYGSLEDFLSDNGLRLLREAMSQRAPATAIY